MTILYMSHYFKSIECSDNVRFDYLEMHTNTLDLYLIGIVVMSVQFKFGQHCDLPVIASYSLYRKVQRSTML